MTDYIIIALLAILVLENSRFGVAIMNWIVLQYKHSRHWMNRMRRK